MKPPLVESSTALPNPRRLGATRRALMGLAFLSAALPSFAGLVIPNSYPLAPPGTSVRLPIESFIQSIPQQSLILPTPNPVVGDHLGQHPGAFGVGFPPLGSFFIGVFGGPINTADPGAAVYLWETTARPNTVPFSGPTIELGYWSGTEFQVVGIPQSASYLGTGVNANDGILEITSSVIPLRSFGIAPGVQGTLNAVRITAAGGHNQVTAVAATVIPEPGTVSFGLVLFAVCASGRLRLRRRLRA